MSTVIAAFGVPCIDDKWIHPEPFERWLKKLEPDENFGKGLGGLNKGLGRVCVWRDEQECVQHAAVSLGQGYLLHKEA